MNDECRVLPDMNMSRDKLGVRETCRFLYLFNTFPLVKRRYYSRAKDYFVVRMDAILNPKN